MNKSKRKLSIFLSMILCAFTLFAALPVSAEITEDVRTQIESGIPSYIQGIFTMTDDQIAQAKTQKGFASVLAQAIEDNREELGELKSVDSTRIDDSDDDTIVTTSKCSFENYQADVILYMNAETMSMTNITINPEYPLSVKLAQAAQNTLVGLLVVGSALIFLSFLISLFKFIPSGKKKAVQAAPAPAAVPAAAPAPAVLSQDEEIAAVIAAAIAMAESESQTGGGYVVRSIKRAGSGRGWTRN